MLYLISVIRRAFNRFLIWYLFPTVILRKPTKSKGNMQFQQVYGEPFIIQCRVQYVNLITPDTGREFSRENYNLQCLIDKQDKATLTDILETCAAVGMVSSYQQLKKHPLLDGNGNLRDGDLPGVKDKAAKGCFYFTVGRKPELGAPPTFTLIDTPDGQVMECHPREIYAGSYCAVLVTPCMYRPGETTLYLNAVTLVKHGQKLAQGKVDPMQAFSNWARPQANLGPTDDMESPEIPMVQPTVVAQAVKMQATAPITQPIQTTIAGIDDAAGPTLPVAESIQPVIAGSEQEPPRRKRGRPATRMDGQETDPLVSSAPTANGRSNMSDLLTE